VLDVSVVVPTLNARAFIDECLASVATDHPREIIVVDGGSSDGTCDIARRYSTKLLRHEGRGVGSARALGIEMTRSNWVLLLDADVILPPGAIRSLLTELMELDVTGLQARLESVSIGSGYWGRALAVHHRWSMADNRWFGFAATLFARETLVTHSFDITLPSGEDLDLVRRLQRAGARLAVSKEIVAVHRFGDTYDDARHQWLADGEGLAAILAKERWRASWLLLLPLGAALRGVVRSVRRRQPRWIGYYACLAFFNYVGMARKSLLDR
jgi:glycosyltransferase involved in cell wall biosynthesis